MNFETLRDEIKEIDFNSKEQAKKYEALENWSFAYLTRWTVLERGLKKLYNLHNREKIRFLALEWVEYIDENNTTKPKNITDFSVKTQSIPRIKFITESIGKCSNIEVVLDSGKKFRIKRNDIAHKAVEFSSKKTYDGYRTAIDAAIKQLITKLSYKINMRKKQSSKKPV